MDASSSTQLHWLFLTIPISSSTSERSFSALKRLYTYLRSSMIQSHLNNCSLLHIHNLILDLLQQPRCLWMKKWNILDILKLFTNCCTVIDSRYSHVTYYEKMNSHVTYLIHCNFFQYSSKNIRLHLSPSPNFLMVSKPLKEEKNLIQYA